MPDALSETLADLRRSERRRADPPRAGCPSEEVTEFVARASEGELGADLPELAERDQRAHRRATRSWCASCGGRSSRRARSRSVDGAVLLTASDRRARDAGERPRGGQPAARAPVSGDHRAARARGDGRQRVRARARAPTASGLAERELVAALDEAVRSGLVEELSGHRLATGSPTSSCAARSTTASPRSGAPSCTCASARLARPPSGRSAAHARRPRPPLHRRGAARRDRARDRVQPARRPRPRPRRSRSARPRAACATALDLGIDDQRERAEVLLELGHRDEPRRASRSTRSAHSNPPRKSPASSATLGCSRARRSATRTRTGVRA